MESWPFSIKFDRTGFPLIKSKEWQFYIALFPVSKYQFEQFMIENGPQDDLYTDDWYGNILSLNPRQKWQECDREPWRLFITGLNENEIKPFLSYLGRNFRLPKVKEWVMLNRISEGLQKIRKIIKQKCQNNSPLPVLHWIEKGLSPLTKEGILEFVTENGNLKFIGKPFNEFHRNLWNPETVRKINWDTAKRLIGFRVVCEER